MCILQFTVCEVYRHIRIWHVCWMFRYGSVVVLRLSLEHATHDLAVCQSHSVNKNLQRFNRVSKHIGMELRNH